MRRSLCAYLSQLLLVSVCGHLALATNAEAQEDGAYPEWFQEALARESRKLRFRDVKIDDGAYRFRLAGKPEKPESFDGGWYLATDVGSAVPLECYVFTEFGDHASTLVNLIEINLESNVEGNSGTLSQRIASAVDAGVIDGAPFLALETIYTIETERGKLIGSTKGRAAVKDDVLLACGHNDAGYRETLAKVFDEFVSSAELPERTSSPYFEEVLIQELNGQRVGFSQVSYFADEEADSDTDFDTRIHLLSSSLLPVSSAAVSSSDSSTVTWSRPDGTVINVYDASSENGELVTDLQLLRDDDGNWVSFGTFQGKDFEQVLDASVQPLSDIGQWRATQTLLSGSDSEIEFPVWISEADPSQFLSGKISRDDPDAPRRVVLELGPLTMASEVDDTGRVERASMEFGAASLVIDRVWTRGDPALGSR